MKFKLVSSVLILLIIASFSYAIHLSLKLQSTNQELKDRNNELEQVKQQLVKSEQKASEELEKCLNDGIRNSWEIASGTNTLKAYSNFATNCKSEEGGCREEDLKKAINSLLNADGYVQMVETDGHRLYTDEPLSLEGEFIKFNNDISVRTGAIGIENCGSPNHTKKGIVLKDKIVKVLDKCTASSSESVWAHIQYTDL